MSSVLFTEENKVPGFGDDHRRTIYEINSPEDGFSIQGFFIKSNNLPLGIHYHERKSELFKIVEGRGFVLLYAVEKTGETINPAKIRREELVAGTVVYVPPMTAHTFYLDPGSRMMSFSTAPYDDNDKDMTRFPELEMKEEPRN